MLRTLILLLTLAFIAAAQAPDANLPVETKAWIATRIYSAIQTYFAHAEGAPDFQLDRDYQVYLKAAMPAGRYGFDLSTLAFVAKLRNGHSFFMDSWLFANGGTPPGMILMSTPEGWVVLGSMLPEIDPGDVAVSVNGKPIEQFYRENDAMIPGSSEAARRRLFSSNGWLWPERFDLALAGGKHVAIDRMNQKLDRLRMLPSAVDHAALPEGLGLIRIPSFGSPAGENEALQRVKELKNAKAILIDVRGNGGGTSPSRLISALLNRPWRGFRFTTPFQIAHAGAVNEIRRLFPNFESDPYWKGSLDAYGDFENAQILTPGPIHAPASDAYQGKVLLLVDGYCNSACEDFVEPFKSSGRGVLVGETTNGSSGQPFMVDFGNGMNFRVSTKRYYLPDGTPFEGVGIKPDVEVIPSLADRKADAIRPLRGHCRSR